MPSDTIDNRTVPEVMIVGGGLGGLMMAILLERIHIPYRIFERASEVKPLGAAMTLCENILPVFEQLGIYEDFLKFSRVMPGANIYNSQLEKLGVVSMRGREEITGYNKQLFARPELHNLLLKHVPAEKIHYAKRVLRTEEKDDKVFIHCSDNTSYSGDILIGADGAYSTIRQSIYKQLDQEGLLPVSDLESLALGYHCMVGVTEPQDPERYPLIKDDVAHFTSVIGGARLSWGVVNIPNNQICWTLMYQFESPDEAAQQKFKNSEWGPQSIDAMIKEFQDFHCPWGGKMGDIIDATPRDLISKVFLEEKLFQTWHHGRTVLLGDACHKMLPAAGQGAINAMQDAVILSNCFYDMQDVSLKSVSEAFSDYYEQRFEHAKFQVENSKVFNKVYSGQTFFERVFRHAVLNYIPYWMQARSFAKAAEYKPQITWLPFAPKRGTGSLLPQKPSKRYAEEQARIQAKNAAAV